MQRRLQRAQRSPRGRPIPLARTALGTFPTPYLTFHQARPAPFPARTPSCHRETSPPQDQRPLRRRRRRRPRLRRPAARRRVREGRLQRHRLRRQRARRATSSTSGESHIQDVPAARSRRPREARHVQATTDDGAPRARPTRSPSPCPRRSARPTIRHELRPGRRRHGRAALRIRACSSSSRAPRTRAPRAKSSSRRSTPAASRSGEDVFLAFSPERVDPGNPVYHTQEHPEGRRRHHAACTELAIALYQSCIDTVVPRLLHRGGGAGEAAREHLPRPSTSAWPTRWPSSATSSAWTCGKSSTPPPRSRSAS